MRLRVPFLAMCIALSALAAAAQTSPPIPVGGQGDRDDWSALARSGRLDEARELLLWDSVRGENDPAALDEYLKIYPSGTYAGLAQQRRERLLRATDPYDAASRETPFPEPAIAVSGGGSVAARPFVFSPGAGGRTRNGSAADATAAGLAAAATLHTLPSGGSVEDYDKAFAALRAEDYEVAEGRLRSFVESHPNDPLRPNAHFWLGEIYMIRNDYDRAAAAFTDALREGPASNKAEEALLKLAMSQGRGGRPAEACATLSRLRPDDPAIGAHFKATLVAERRRFGC